MSRRGQSSNHREGRVGVNQKIVSMKLTETDECKACTWCCACAVRSTGAVQYSTVLSRVFLAVIQ